MTPSRLALSAREWSWAFRDNMSSLRESSLIEKSRRWRPRASRFPLASGHEPLTITEGEEAIKERENRWAREVRTLYALVRLKSPF